MPDGQHDPDRETSGFLTDKRAAVPRGKEIDRAEAVAMPALVIGMLLVIAAIIVLLCLILEPALHVNGLRPHR